MNMAKIYHKFLELAQKHQDCCRITHRNVNEQRQKTAIKMAKKSDHSNAHDQFHHHAKCSASVFVFFKKYTQLIPILMRSKNKNKAYNHNEQTITSRIY